jgi:hypothetical protein
MPSGNRQQNTTAVTVLTDRHHRDIQPPYRHNPASTGAGTREAPTTQTRATTHHHGSSSRSRLAVQHQTPGIKSETPGRARRGTRGNKKQSRHLPPVPHDTPTQPLEQGRGGHAGAPGRDRGRRSSTDTKREETDQTQPQHPPSNNHDTPPRPLTGARGTRRGFEAGQRSSQQHRYQEGTKRSRDIHRPTLSTRPPDP